MPRRLAIWLPNWPVQRLVAGRPELTGRAIVIYERHARYGSQVKACSPLAFAQGVRLGMPLAEAQAMLAPGVRELAGTEQPHPDLSSQSARRWPRDPAYEVGDSAGLSPRRQQAGVRTGGRTTSA